MVLEAFHPLGLAKSHIPQLISTNYSEDPTWRKLVILFENK